MKRVAVLLASFNGEKYISSQVASILNQIDVDLDLYIRDDGSKDQTVSLIKSICNTRIKLLLDGINTGSPAGNFFKLMSEINIDSYDFIAFSDQDDIWFPDKIISAINFIDLKSADAYSSNLIAFSNEKLSSWYLKKFSGHKNFDYLFQGASAGCTYVLTKQSCKLILAVLTRGSTSLLVGCSHDWLIYAICRSHGLRWAHDNRAFILYRQHAINSYGAMPGFLGLISRFYLSLDGWYRSQILWQGQFLAQNEAEVQILDAIKNLKIRDKIFLLSLVFNFRRSTRDCLLLSLVIIFGIL